MPEQAGTNDTLGLSVLLALLIIFLSVFVYLTATRDKTLDKKENIPTMVDISESVDSEK